MPKPPADRDASNPAALLPVLHVLDAMGGGQHLWGKERVALSLMREQRASGAVEPWMATFAPSLAGQVARDEGFPVFELASSKARFSRAWGDRLADLLHERPGSVLHTHGYKANLIGRLPGCRRAAGAVIATCHGWVDTTPQLRLYNWLDRRTAGRSDLVTVPDPAMSRRFPASVRVEFVPNGVVELPAPSAERRAAARARFEFPAEVVVAGMLGRMSDEKGVHEFIAAADQSSQADLWWVAAGAGPLADLMRKHSRIRYLGYVDAEEFLAAIDVFVQPSRTEALSLSLLEAARAARSIVATRVGATDYAVRDGIEALLVDVDPKTICTAVERVAADPKLRETLGRAARARFETALGLRNVHQRYLSLYREAIARRGS